MVKLLDAIVVVDVEATCWEGKAPQDQQSEIIEIGLCLLDLDSLSLSEKCGILVKPIMSSVSDFCTKLTTLTQKQVDKGISFKEACEILIEKYHTKKRTWASYGAYDRLQFERQCKSFGIPYPFGSNHINVKNLYALLTKKSREVGMKRALDELGISLEGTHHRGQDDAWNIGKILLKILDTARSL
ncbi:MAG: DNA polymerase III [Candidatus Lokiarchaeota archaeon]|nr:DNA polymerase III [Candidatus Lokiarchaeota archaeon]